MQSLFISLLVALADGYIGLTYPPLNTIDEDKQTKPPCGLLNISIPDRAETLWYIAGSPLGWKTSHHTAKYSIQAALVNDMDNWRCLVPVITQLNGPAHFCLPCIPGIVEWAGENAIVQIVQETEDKTLYQCIRVKMFDGGTVMPMPDERRGVCKNNTDFHLGYESPSPCNTFIISLLPHRRST